MRRLQERRSQNTTRVHAKKARSRRRPHYTGEQIVPQELREEWGDFVAWDATAAARRRSPATRRPRPRRHRPARGRIHRHAPGERRRGPPGVRPDQAAASHYTPGADRSHHLGPVEANESLARQIAKNPGKTLFVHGMGPNHFFNNDLKDRDGLPPGGADPNIGTHGGNIGSYAGNYRGAYLQRPAVLHRRGPVPHRAGRARRPAVYEALLRKRVGALLQLRRPASARRQQELHGQDHMPTPTKFMWFSNGNSILGNLKWHYDVVVNTLAQDRDDRASASGGGRPPASTPTSSSPWTPGPRSRCRT